MSETPKSTARELASRALARFRELSLRPKKSFGQNFLADPRAAQAIAELAATPEQGTVVEIGAGLGALTAHLLSQAARVVAIERDRDLCPILRETFVSAIDSGALEVLEADAKSVDYPALLASGPRPHAIAGNLPYQLSGPLLQLATEHATVIDRAVFMLQKEVADRLGAAPGTDDYGALTVFVAAAFRVERARDVPRGAFRPAPNVDSAVVLLLPRGPARVLETAAFRALVKGAFHQRRKALRNAWSDVAPREKLDACAKEAGIDLGLRGETLSVDDFARMADCLER
jgi:16S rRNA (adenine1518-N6/adenine1519-N6)-dimethyltransferase